MIVFCRFCKLSEKIPADCRNFYTCSSVLFSALLKEQFNENFSFWRKSIVLIFFGHWLTANVPETFFRSVCQDITSFVHRPVPRLISFVSKKKFISFSHIEQKILGSKVFSSAGLSKLPFTCPWEQFEGNYFPDIFFSRFCLLRKKLAPWFRFF